MSKGKANQTHYDNLMGIFTGYNDVFNALYRLKTNDEEKLNAIYKKIEQNLIDSYKIPPDVIINDISCLLYTSPSPRDLSTSRMPSSA